MTTFKNFVELSKFMFNTYGVKADFPFKDDSETAVFRHKSSGKKAGKWFCLFMRIPQNTFREIGNKIINVINLKCDPELAVILHDGKGIFPAYHMNKKHWISVILDAVPKSQVVDLIEESWELTKR
ncbi:MULTISPECIES: MmcQ/YjbR family DNA-binding protein [unclassified Campylobacter]|uniref:MmcQ/YjbR family DNA-binding protein n=1 Tax=unclassified Campylobacter TaxID=2593542 RepID=UPI0022E9C089|nr:MULTISPECIES: MmcQ/YjbR family DNA-binding protein [unclassified Campylobacter]MDA3080056.1 MmcQ/YjbR family DNA-binding protein [Campylobacter sp. CS_NA2]MDA3086113.1 MmcQ/YjbR family DNA-binding protein [Campylobacter sp. CS_ED1]MDA3090938.1 MmcQ/YjbR family DNA-binding protein [Campylobacter sp. CS_ED2]WBR51207.1 MmcQ/YjbR family DNA-binding protein [Campylobacter sp. CS_NA3]